ncbi:hypothetical protein C8Q72DRAFT_45517 [Fomitopsis betulina]|nr:hypothetical protein C8Q72DRAFT_45517 [Fomitopsis betulina]
MAMILARSPLLWTAIATLAQQPLIPTATTLARLLPMMPKVMGLTPVVWLPWATQTSLPRLNRTTHTLLHLTPQTATRTRRAAFLRRPRLTTLQLTHRPLCPLNLALGHPPEQATTAPHFLNEILVNVREGISLYR